MMFVSLSFNGQFLVRVSVLFHRTLSDRDSCTVGFSLCFKTYRLILVHGDRRDSCSPDVHQVWTRCAPGVHYLGVYHVITVHQVCTKCAPGVHWCVHQVCSATLPNWQIKFSGDNSTTDYIIEIGAVYGTLITCLAVKWDDAEDFKMACVSSVEFRKAQ